MTIFSPHTVGRLATRRSIFLPPKVTESRPSCGTRRSAMSMSAMIFRRLMTPAWIERGDRMMSCSTPSMRNRTRSSRSPGSMWMSEARSAIAWAMSRLTNLTIGASSTISLTRASSSSSWLSSRVWVRSSRASSLRWKRSIADDQVGLGGDHGLDVASGERADVVDGEDVRRVGHGDDQPAVLVADRQGDVAAGDVRSDVATALPSTGNSPRSTNCRPICSASAATSCDSVTIPRSTRTRPRLRPSRCCSSMAVFSCS